VKIALIHDWLTGMRGGERALLAFCEMFPDADLFTLVRVPGATDPIIERRRVRTSVIQHLPFPGRLYRHYLPLFPLAIEQFDLDGYDLVLSTSHCAAKSVVVAGHTRHLCYCLTPMRYAWDQFDAYFGPERVGEAVSRVMRPVMAAMARWDRATESRVHRYLAISQYVARRISLYYNRLSSIVYPPVETTFYTPEPSAPPNGLLVVSALVPYKRVDLAISAARLAKMPLTIVGDGPELDALQRLGGDGVVFRGWCTNEEIRDLYRSSIAAILPGEEDFGIVPLEAQACGRPVVALGRGGARETVIDGRTGVLVEPGVEALADGLKRAAGIRWNPADIRDHAERFSRARFVSQIQEAIDETMAAPAGHRW
jgi:glycosyltransferase involved in cell wall biosynthesis